MAESSWQATKPPTKAMDTPLELREEIPALADHTYFNWGASGPSPSPVLEAVEAGLEWHEYRSPADKGMYPAAEEVFDAARNEIATLFDVRPAEIALTQSTTEGINRVATALDWGPGDVVVTTDLEHAAGRLPWKRLASKFGIEVRVVETEAGVLDPSAVHDLLAEAELFCFSAIDWMYGRRQPVSALVDVAHENDALALVDAVQMPGQTPVDMEAWGADVVAGAGHKWLLGPWGAGFLYVSDRVIDSLEPIHVGYRSTSSTTGGEYELAPDARRFELGTMSPGPFAGLQTAIELHRSIGTTTIQDRIRSLRERFVDGMAHERLYSPPAADSGLVTVRVEDSESMVATLAQEGISVRSVPMPGAVRVSIHATNTAAEIDSLRNTFEAAWN